MPFRNERICLLPLNKHLAISIEAAFRRLRFCICWELDSAFVIFQLKCVVACEWVCSFDAAAVAPPLRETKRLTPLEDLLGSDEDTFQSPNRKSAPSRSIASPNRKKALGVHTKEKTKRSRSHLVLTKEQCRFCLRWSDEEDSIAKQDLALTKTVFLCWHGPRTEEGVEQRKCYYCYRLHSAKRPWMDMGDAQVEEALADDRGRA